MSDDDLAWDDDAYEPVVAKTVVTRINEDEDEDEEKEAKKPAAGKPAKKAAEKKGADKTAASSSVAAPAADLDPLAEKLRLQRLQEAADFDAARAAFGGEGKNLDDLCPATEEDFTEYGDVLYYKYLRTYEARILKNGNFKAALKSVLRQAANAMSTHELKEVESSIVALRNAKMKEERDSQQKAAKKAAAKAKPQLKGNIDGDLDDVRYAREALDDEYDFM